MSIRNVNRNLEKKIRVNNSYKRIEKIKNKKEEDIVEDKIDKNEIIIDEQEKNINEQQEQQEQKEQKKK